MPQIVPNQGEVVKLRAADGHKVYGVVTGANTKMVEVSYPALNTDTGTVALHHVQVTPNDVRFPRMPQNSEVCILLRQLTGVYAPPPVAAPADPEVALQQAADKTEEGGD